MTERCPEKRPAWRRWLPELALVAVVLTAHAEALFTPATFFYRDLGMAVRPVLENVFAGDDLVLPAWCQWLSNGRPLMANPGYALLHPTTLVYLVLPFRHAFDVFIVLQVLVTALLMSASTRWLGVGAPARFVAGCAWAFGGYVVSAMNLYPTLVAVAWAPLTLWASLAVAVKATPRRVGLLGLGLGLQALGGQPEPLVLGALAAFGWGLALPAGRLAERARRLLAGWSAAGVIALLLAAPQLVPALLFTSGTIRSLGFTAKALLYNSLHPARLTWLAWPHVGGHPMDALKGEFPGGALTDTGSPYLVSLYAGVSVLLLAVAALTLGRRPGGAASPARLGALPWVLAGTAVLGLLLALGRHVPGAGALAEAVPALVPFRYPVKLVIWTFLALPLLAALGLEELIRQPTMRARRSAVALVALIVALDLTSSHVRHAPLISASALGSRPTLVRRLEQVAAERGIQDDQWRLHHHRLLERWSVPLPPLERDVQSQYRFEQRLLFPATGVAAGVHHAFERSGDLLDLTPYFALSRQLHQRGDEALARGLGESGVLFVISPEDDLGKRTGGLLVRLGSLGQRSGVPPRSAWLYRNEAFLPRARFVTGLEALERPTVEDVADRWSSPTRWPPLPLLPPIPIRAEPAPPGVVRVVVRADSGDPVVVDLDFAEAQRRAPGTVRIAHEDHRSLVLDVDARVGGLLVVSDVWAPGWSVTLDGEPWTAWPANVVFRAAPVPEGRHVIRFEYRPPGLVAGLVLGAVGLALLVALLVRDSWPSGLRRRSDDTGSQREEAEAETA